MAGQSWLFPVEQLAAPWGSVMGHFGNAWLALLPGLSVEVLVMSGLVLRWHRLIASVSSESTHAAMLSMQVEAVLCSHKAVAAAAVVGLPDERLGEQVSARLGTTHV